MELFKQLRSVTARHRDQRFQNQLLAGMPAFGLGPRQHGLTRQDERFDGLRELFKGMSGGSEQLTLLDATDNTPVVFGPKLVDVVHLLSANAEQGERLDHLVERFRGQREQIRAALQYLKQFAPNRWSKSADKLLPFYDDMFAHKMVSKE